MKRRGCGGGFAARDADAAEALIAAYKPGVTVRVPVQRLGQMREFPLAFAPNPYHTYTLKPMEHPTAQQKAIYNSWLGIR